MYPCGFSGGRRAQNSSDVMWTTEDMTRMPRENVQTVTDKQKKLPPRRAYRHCSQINVLTKYTHTHKPRSISLSKNECLTYTPTHTHKPLKRSAPYYSTSSDMFSVFLYIVGQRHFCLPLCSIWHMRDMPKYLWVFIGSSLIRRFHRVPQTVRSTVVFE